MKISDFKPYFRKADPIRWGLGLLLCYFVFTETGIATLFFSVLVFFESESRTILDRINREKDKEITRNLKTILACIGNKECSEWHL